MVLGERFSCMEGLKTKIKFWKRDVFFIGGSTVNTSSGSLYFFYCATEFEAVMKKNEKKVANSLPSPPNTSNSKQQPIQKYFHFISITNKKNKNKE